MKDAENFLKLVRTPTTAKSAGRKFGGHRQNREIFPPWDTLQEMSERMIIDALPVRNNILLGIMETKTGNVVVDAMIQSAFRACIEELDGAPVVEVPEWRRASDPPPTHNETWHDGDEVYSGETSMKVWAYCADGTQHDAHYEIHDGNGQWFVEGKDDKFSEHGNVTHWMYYPAAPKD